MLREWCDGDRAAFDQLMPLVYDELHHQAALFRRRERQDHTLQTTALIHEAYLKLIDQRDVRWQNRNHFFAVASQMIRRVLVDHARARHRIKRGGAAMKVTLSDDLASANNTADVDLVALDDALEQLAALDPRQARVIELRFFAGLSIEETAETLNLSPATVKREWVMARAWLFREMRNTAS